MANKDNDLLKRVKPINIEAEKSLLSTMFLSSYSRDRAFDTLRTEDFVEYKNQLIFDAMRSVSDKVVELEVNSIVNELRDRNKFDACGGLDYISEVLLCESVASNSDYYLGLVKEAAIRRNVIDLGETISRNAYNSDVEIENLIEEAEKNIVGMLDKAHFKWSDINEYYKTVNIYKLSKEFSNKISSYFLFIS
mgnify:CR=1 FL=1